MNLCEYFNNQCRNTSVLLKCQSPSFKIIDNKKNILGTIASFDFDDFKLDITFYEKGGSFAAQQTLWLTFILKSDEAIPFSVYDILAFLEENNFNCYTFSYVDSNELMENCFEEINTLLERLVPKLNEFLKNGVEKNKLLTAQRNSIDNFFGDKVLESGEMIGASADKLINMMIKTFHDSELEEAVIGPIRKFFEGREQFALKKLKKSKAKTPYEINLIKYIEQGGKAEKLSEVAKNASMQKGVVRHGGGAKGALRLILLSLLFDFIISAVLVAIFYIICKISFQDSILFMGFYENIFSIFAFSLALAVALAFKYTKHKGKNISLNREDVQSPETTASANKMIMYLTIMAEILALIGCMTSVNCTSVFYQDYFKYSQDDFPLSQQTCDYSAVDFIGVIGDTDKKDAEGESYLVVRTKSGSTINLYYSTWLSAHDFSLNADFLKEKGIEILNFDTYEDYENKR